MNKKEIITLIKSLKKDLNPKKDVLISDHFEDSSSKYSIFLLVDDEIKRLRSEKKENIIFIRSEAISLDDSRALIYFIVEKFLNKGIGSILELKVINNLGVVVALTGNQSKLIYSEEEFCIGAFDDCKENCLYRKARYSKEVKEKLSQLGGDVYSVSLNSFNINDKRFFFETIEKKIDLKILEKAVSNKTEEGTFFAHFIDVLEVFYISRSKSDYIEKIGEKLSSIFNSPYFLLSDGDSLYEFRDKRLIIKNEANLPERFQNVQFITDIKDEKSFSDLERYGRYIIYFTASSLNSELAQILFVTDRLEEDILNLINLLSGQIFLCLNYFEKVENERLDSVKLFQREKMASLGQLYLGITHEINNPNTFISGNSELIEMNIEDIREMIANGVDKNMLLKKMDDIDESLKDIMKGSERIDSIVQNLKLFSRFDYSNVRKNDIKRIISEAIRVSQYRAKDKDLFELISRSGEFNVKVNHDEMLQVFVNIFLNSIQSIEKKKEMLEGSFFQGRIQVEIEIFDKEICIKVEDNGAGMDKIMASKVFDPFFTTKGNDGTGLGMNIVYNIIAKYSGRIKVETELDSFFRTIINLPIA